MCKVEGIVTKLELQKKDYVTYSFLY